MKQSFLKTPEEVCSFFQVDSSHGLSKDRVKEAQAKYGKNGKSFFEIRSRVVVPHHLYCHQSYQKKRQPLYGN